MLFLIVSVQFGKALDLGVAFLMTTTLKKHLCSLTWVDTLRSLDVFDPLIESDWQWNGSRRPLSRHLHCHSQQVHLFPRGIQHVVLPSKNISHLHQALAITGTFMWRNTSDRWANTLTHIDTGVVGQYAIIGQSNILLLPFLVEGVSTALQQEPLMNTRNPNTDNWLAKSFMLLSEIPAIWRLVFQ